MHQSNNNAQIHYGWQYKLARFGLLVFICVIVVEVTARAFWSVKYGVPFLNPSLILYAKYPQLKKIDKTIPSHSDEFYDILLLGASVLHKDWGIVERELLEQLGFKGFWNVRIFNPSQPGHTSRDSLLKYSSLDEARFDLVIFYHGINESQANNAPPSIYREDYGHLGWYEIVNKMASYHKTCAFALPYTLSFLNSRIKQVLNQDHFVPKKNPRPDWLHYGESCNSSASFKNNVRAILDLASYRGDRMLLMTYAYHIRDDSSSEVFNKNYINSALHITPIEIWGKADNVKGALAAHNKIIRTLAIEYSDVLFLDQESLIQKSSQYFNDPCHFTTAGSVEFVKNLLEILLPDLKTYRSDPKPAKG